MYAILNIPHEIKDEVLQIDKMEFKGKCLIIEEENLARRNEGKRKNRKDIVCRFFNENRCKKGNNCEYKARKKRM